MELTSSRYSNLQPVLKRHSWSLKYTKSVLLGLFEWDFRETLGERSNDTLKRLAVKIAEQYLEYEPLMVYWTEESSASTGPSDHQKFFFAFKYSLDRWARDDKTQTAHELYFQETDEGASNV